MQRFVFPTPPAPPAARTFPWLASAAPVVGAVILWLWLQSPYVLLFALLGPLIAVASAFDAKLSGRKQRAREQQRFARDCERLRERVAAASAEAKAAMECVLPGPRALAQLDAAHPERWRYCGGALAVVIGSGDRATGLQLEHADDDGEYAEEVARLERDLGTVRGPVAMDATEGIGLIGPQALTFACARQQILSVLHAMPPNSARVLAQLDDEREIAWLSELPHPVEVAREPGLRVRILSDDGDCTIAAAAHAAQLPRECRARISVAFPSASVHASPPESVELTALSLPEASAWAAALSAAAEQCGFDAAGGIPSHVAFGALPVADASGLSAVFLQAAEPVTLDLVADGPHAVVGGTTGSGKSELLIAWVAALARAHAPTGLNVLLVDFKGGSAFDSLAALRHCVGVITDLDPAGAKRAIESLRAELRYRERFLAQSEARDIAQCAGLPRLVIVVDEFAAMLDEHPDLHRLFVDIAARGRSLGVHLVLCTQRPADAVRDALMANCGIRISLRVNDEQDALAVTGERDAAHIALEHRGRCFVRVAGSQTYMAQAALAMPSDIADLVARASDGPAPRRPWRDPLPEHVDASQLQTTALGLVDRPAQQRIDEVCWEVRDGNLLVLGAAASGKSTFAQLCAGRSGARLYDRADSLYDHLVAPPEAGVVVIDDLDLVLARAGEHAHELTAMLSRRLREAAGRDSAYVLTARRITGALQNVAALADWQIVLRMASRQEHVLAGGVGSEYDAELPAGGGTLRGERIQLALPARVMDAIAPIAVPVPDGDLAVVLAPFAMLPNRLLEREAVVPGESGPLVVGNAAEWEAAWGSLDALSAHRPVLVLGVDARRVQQLDRSAPQPPLSLDSDAWMYVRGVAKRVSL